MKSTTLPAVCTGRSPRAASAATLSACLLAVMIMTPPRTSAQSAEAFGAELTIRADQPQGTINRNDVVAALKNLSIPVIRWPGGCFADEYHWRDGVGPRAQRPKRLNTSWGGVVETNAFGTHEFLDFCEMIGADPYISGNVGSGTPQEMMDWVEYMTADSDSELANLRRRHGREKPWKIPYFGVGNESWGCGGNMRPEYYADEYPRLQTFV